MTPVWWHQRRLANSRQSGASVAARMPSNAPALDMASKPRRKDIAEQKRADQPHNNGAAATSAAGAPASPDATIGATLTALIELVHELAVARSEQLELTETLLSAAQNLIDEVAELRGDVAALQQRPGTIAPTGTGLPDTSDGYQDLREDTDAARRHSGKLRERSAALSARAKALVAESQSITAAVPRSPRPPRSGH